MKSLPHLLLLVVALLSPFMFHEGYKFYIFNTEAHPSSYETILLNLEKYPDDKLLHSSIANAVSDGVLVGKEYHAFMDLVLERHGYFIAANLNSETQNAKSRIMDIIHE